MTVTLKYETFLFYITMTEKRLCSCGNETSVMKRFEGLPCNFYCCGCCPHKNETPCPQEKSNGTLVDQLAKWQS